MGLLLDKHTGCTNVLIYSVIVFVIFFLILTAYYCKNDSCENEPKEIKRLKTTRKLEEALDAVLNKNTNSTD